MLIFPLNLFNFAHFNAVSRRKEASVTASNLSVLGLHIYLAILRHSAILSTDRPTPYHTDITSYQDPSLQSLEYRDRTSIHETRKTHWEKPK